MKTQKKRRILMTADTLGGVWTYAINLSRAMIAQDTEVHLATMGKKLSPSQWSEVADLEDLTIHESEYKLEWMPDPWEDVSRSKEWLVELEAEIDPEVIHLNTLVHATADFGTPVITVCHSDVYTWFTEVKGQLPGPEWETYRHEVAESLKNSDLVVGISQFTLDKTEQFYGDLPQKELIYNGLPPHLYNYKSQKKEMIFSMGRIWDEAKNFKALQEVAPQVEWEIEVAGNNRHPNGDDHMDLPHLQLVGMLSSREIIRRLATASIFVLPAKYEPFGLSALEAAFSCCALLLSDIPSLREVWQDCAIYFDPNDPEDLQVKLNQLENDFYLRDEMSRRARNRAFRFTLEKSATRYLRAYDQFSVRQLQPSL